MKKILFIEDEPNLQKTVGEILRAEGFEILEATDGEAGILLAKARHPDIILLDIILPKKDGFEVMKELKEDPETARSKIIVLTNLESSSDVERALALGATTYLVKANYNLEDVVAKIKQILGE
ncbi:MAG: response regulator [Candidatus Spechtbacteria bacterium]|nr:response regulator [Candidatus Spechtbacteria bacterium]